MQRVHDTKFTGIKNPDVLMQERFIREKYTRNYPTITYYKLQKGFPVTQTGDTEQRTSQGVVDDLWGEDAPAPESRGLDWKNPHTDANLDATKGVGRKKVGKIHVKVTAEPSEKQLTTHGVNEKRSIMVIFPCCLLEDLGITVDIGDQFDWEGQRMSIKAYKPKGYWRATSHHFFVEAVAVYASVGS